MHFVGADAAVDAEAVNDYGFDGIRGEGPQLRRGSGRRRDATHTVGLMRSNCAYDIDDIDDIQRCEETIGDRKPLAVRPSSSTLLQATPPQRR